MKCKKCGKNIKESDLYCDNCGEMINDIDNNDNKTMKIILIILSEFITLALLLGLFLFSVDHYVKKLNLDNFSEVLKNRNYTIQDKTKEYKKEGYIDNYYFSENNDKSMSFNYVLSNKKSDYMFEVLKSQAKNNSGNGFYKTANVDLFNYYNYYSIEKNDKYYVVIKTSNSIFASECTLEHKTEVQDIVKDLHLTYPKEINFLLVGFILLIYIIIKIVMWKIFVKAGKKGWQCLIPIYNYYCISEIAFKKGWYFIFMLITPINIIFNPIWLYKIAKSFGKSTAFSICNVLFPYITMQIIAFDNSEYNYKTDKQNNDNKIDDELIKYKNININEDSNLISMEKHDIKSKDNNEMYEKVTKIQNRNSIVFCIGIFLYFLSFAWAMLYYNVEEEQYNLLLIPMFTIALIATGLLIFCKVTNPKEGKIKYKYKNEKIYYFTILIFTISLFILFDGLTAFNIDFKTESALWFAITGLAVSSLIYYLKSSGKSKIKIKKPVKIIITILMLVFGFMLAIIVSDDSEELDIVDEYSKSSLVVYDKESTPFLLSKSNKGWYFAVNEIGSSKMELSASSKPEDLNIFYDVDNAAIRGLAGNDKVVVWSTETKNKLIFFYYDIEENTNYELMTIEGMVEDQNPRIELYNDKIYYEYIDYENHKSEIHEFNTTTGKERILKTYEVNGNNENDLLYKIFMISNENLFIIDNEKLTKIDIDNNYSESTVTLDAKVNNIYSVSYDKDYAIYYSNDLNEERIDLFDENGKMEKHVYTFKNKHYAYYDKVIMDKGNIYWIDKGTSDDMVNNYNLSIYNIKQDKIQKVKKVFNYIVDDKVYGLGFYGDSIENVRLYEISY